MHLQTEKTYLPEGFKTMARELLSSREADSFLDAMTHNPATSVRLNRRKPGAVFPGARPVKWCRSGFYLDQRPSFTLDPLLHAGAYYVQDASSMIYEELTERIVAALCGHSTQPLSLLDVCAAPGGKTTAMINALPDGSHVIANEYVGKRAGILRENLTKWGYPDVNVTNRDSSVFASAGDAFDIVAVDAPCSGEGMMRKDSDAVAQWSPELVEQCAALQREILRNAAAAVKPGGFLIYSTCTFNRSENELNAEFISSELEMIPFEPGFPEEWGIRRGIGTALPVYRFMPHLTEGEGLFLAVFRRPGEWEPSLLRRKITPLRHNASATRPQNRSNRKADVEIPPIEEVLSLDFDRSRFPEAELSREQALAYLRREAIVLDTTVPKGPAVVTFKGLPLGMVKNIGNRANNLYPKNWRILMR